MILAFIIIIEWLSNRHLLYLAFATQTLREAERDLSCGSGWSSPWPWSINQIQTIQCQIVKMEHGEGNVPSAINPSQGTTMSPTRQKRRYNNIHEFWRLFFSRRCKSDIPQDFQGLYYIVSLCHWMGWLPGVWGEKGCRYLQIIHGPGVPEFLWWPRVWLHVCHGSRLWDFRHLWPSPPATVQTDRASPTWMVCGDWWSRLAQPASRWRVWPYHPYPSMQSMQRSGLLLLRLYKKKAWDMATPDFQRLVRMDPENVTRVANSHVWLFVVMSHPWHHGLFPNFSLLS